VQTQCLAASGERANTGTTPGPSIDSGNSRGQTHRVNLLTVSIFMFSPALILGLVASVACRSHCTREQKRTIQNTLIGPEPSVRRDSTGRSPAMSRDSSISALEVAIW
jgi:hypothetical protein